MARFILGDYVRPINTKPGLPLNSVWVVQCYSTQNGVCVLDGISPTDPDSYPTSYVFGRVFSDCDFELVVMVDGQWKAVNPLTDIVDPSAPDELFHFGGAVTGRISSSVPNMESTTKANPVESADKLVEQAVATLDAAKENARKAREEARAAAKAEAKRKAAAEAAKKASEERQAISARLHKDRGLAVATIALISELSRLHNGGAEQTASPDIAAHADQLQPLAKSYGYKIAKPGVIAIVVKA